MNTKIIKIQDDIINEFNQFQDWIETYEHIISLGKSLDPLDDSFKTDANAIAGCQSQVWLHAERNTDSVHFSVDSDSLLIRGLISLLLRVVNEQTPYDIIHTEFFFIEKIGLNSHLSPSRSNGLHSIINQIRTATMGIY